ncbi:MAG: ABC transporter substrate-binding protein [Solirubrobacteraceae bacterium]
MASLAERTDPDSLGALLGDERAGMQEEGLMRRSISTGRPATGVAALICAVALAACGSSSNGSSASGAGASAAAAGGSGSTSGSGGSASGGAPVNGGTLQAGMVADPDHLDTALSYTNEGWEILEATNDGLLTFKKAAGTEGGQIVPDLATAMPTMSDHGLTYTFHVRTGVMFSPPVDRQVEPSDIKFSIERLFRVNSGGESFYTDIAGASRYAKTRKGGISGIVANDATHTISFHLSQPDGTFLEYMAMPFAFVVPKGTPNSDISTNSRWRIATGPYMISQYVPKDHITIVRNPSFHQWTPAIPNGHLDRIQVTIGVTPDQAVNEIADGQLDWYFEAIAPDRLAQLKAQYPSQVHMFTRNNITFFTLNTRKPPLNNVLVRQAINYAVNRAALVKIFGGQGTASENVIPPGIPGYVRHDFYPYNLAKAKSLVAQSHTAGASITVFSPNDDPYPAAAQYMAGVLDSLGYKATVKTLNEGIYYDTMAAEATDPQISWNDWSEDFPEAEDFIDTQLNGEGISNVGNNNMSNLDVPSLNKQMDRAREMPLGAARFALWARIDAEVTKDYAPLVVFMNREWPKFVSSRLHGLVFNGTYYELLPEMWLSK